MFEDVFMGIVKSEFPSGHMTSIQRRLNVDATSWRCIDVEATLYRRHVSAGFFLIYYIIETIFTCF